MGGAPFYTLQDLHETQQEPVDYRPQPNAMAQSTPAMTLAPGTPLPPTGPAAGSAGVAQGPTLGQVQQAQDQPEPDIQQRLQQYLHQAEQMYAPFIKEKYTAPPRVPMAAAIMSGGRAVADAANYANRYNAQADRENTVVRMKMLETARQLMQSDVTNRIAKQRLALSLVRSRSRRFVAMFQLIQQKMPRRVCLWSPRLLHAGGSTRVRGTAIRYFRP